MNMTELRKLSNAELKKISLEVDSKGCHTVQANNAMKIRNERSFSCNHDFIPDKPDYNTILNSERGIASDTMGWED